MAAMALALDVRLAKPGVYTLHPAWRSPLQPEDTTHALQLAGRVVAMLLPASAAAVGLAKVFA